MQYDISAEGIHKSITTDLTNRSQTEQFLSTKSAPN